MVSRRRCILLENQPLEGGMDPGFLSGFPCSLQPKQIPVSSGLGGAFSTRLLGHLLHPHQHHFRFLLVAPHLVPFSPHELCLTPVLPSPSSAPPPSRFSQTPIPSPALQAPHLSPLCPNPLRSVPYIKSNSRVSSDTFIPPCLPTAASQHGPSLLHPPWEHGEHQETVPRLCPASRQQEGQGGGKSGQ